MFKHSYFLGAFLIVAALLFPRLGTFGFWDPSEVRIADSAAPKASPTAKQPPWSTALQTLGFTQFGTSEWGGRVPLAICGLFCLALLAMLGTQLLHAEAALWAVLILATSAGFLFHTRQLASDILGQTASLAAWGGLGLAVVRRDVASRLLGLACGCMGLVLGLFCRGGLAGVLLPLCAVTWAAKGWSRALFGIASFAALFSIYLLGHAPDSYIPLLGAPLHIASAPPTFDMALKPLAYALFPWTGLALVAIPLLLLSGEDSQEHQARHLVFGVSLLGVFAVLALSWLTQADQRNIYPVLPALALAAGALIRDARQSSAKNPIAAATAACGAFIIGRDLFLSPDVILPPLLGDGVKFPVELYVAQIRPEYVLLTIGLTIGAASLLLWGAIPGAPATALPRVTTKLKAIAPIVFVICGIAYGLFHTQGLVPALSQHLSSKNLLADFQKLRRPGEKLLRYRTSGRGSETYAGEPVEEIRSSTQLLDQLGNKNRVFALVGASELAALDQAARKRDVSYYVLDDSSSRTLLISNLLRPGEKDKNSLRQAVSTDAPKPSQKLEVNFDDKVELVGYDLPRKIARGTRLEVVFYFHVTATLPANYKLFIHFDQPAYRFHGDHEPLEGRLPTQYWTSDTYVTDKTEVDVPRVTTPAGRYEVYMGFWKGDDRLKVLSGPQDGSDRVKLGSLVVE